MENTIIYFNANLIVSYMTKERILRVLASFSAYASDISSDIETTVRKL